MLNLDGWDIALYVSAGYVAVRTLVWMMAARRDGLRERFRRQMEGRREAERGAKKGKQQQSRRSHPPGEQYEDEAKAA